MTNGGGRGGGGGRVLRGRLAAEEKESPRTMTHTMRERLSEKNGPHKTVFGVLSNKKYEVRKECVSYKDRHTVHTQI